MNTIHPKVKASALIGLLTVLVTAVGDAVSSHHGQWTAAAVAAAVATVVSAVAGYLTPSS